MIPMNQTVTVEAKTGPGDFGTPALAAPVSSVCRWEEKHRLVRDKEGKEVISSAVCWLPSSVACPVDSRLTFDGKKYIVLAVEKTPDLGGAVPYQKVFV